MGRTYLVGIADMKLSAEPGDLIITHALGSCLGITAYDPVACVGGLLHAMLPLSSLDAEKAARNPYIFVDCGVEALLNGCLQLGAEKKRLAIKASGGACLRGSPENDYFQIGRKNFLVLRRLLAKNQLAVEAHDVGGNHSRTMWLEIGSGRVLIRTNRDLAII